MKIAYIAPYQGPWLVKKRPCLRNLSLGGKTKIELIAELLQRSSHQAEILSQGEVIERQLRFYPAFSEPEPFHPRIPVQYASAFPVRFLNGWWSSLSTLRMFQARHRESAYDLVLIYNLKPPQVACANYAGKHLRLPVVLEYEDDLFLQDADGKSFTSRYYLSRASKLLHSLSGCMSGSLSLLSQLKRDVPKLVLCGVVGESFEEAVRQAGSSRRNWVVFSGTHSKAQGLEQLIEAWNMAKLPDWELHIAGHGAMTATLHDLAANTASIVFHGLLDRDENARMLGTGKIAVVPYDISQTRGFSFKTIEYLAAGLHVVTTPLTALEALEPELQPGLTRIADNAPATIAASLKQLVTNRGYNRTVEQAALSKYGPVAIGQALDSFLNQVMSERMSSNKRNLQPVPRLGVTQNL